MWKSLVLVGVLFAGVARADEMVTSDTLDYCNALAARMAQRDLPPDARALLLAGRAMCERGHVVGGLRRLRLAAVILRGRAEAP